MISNAKNLKSEMMKTGSRLWALGFRLSAHRLLPTASRLLLAFQLFSFSAFCAVNFVGVYTTTNGTLLTPTNFWSANTNAWGTVVSNMVSGLVVTNGVTAQQAATIAIAETNSYGTINFLHFCGTNTPMPTLKASDGYNAHGWYDQSTNLQAAIAYVATNSVNIRNLYLPQGIYRIAATNLLIPSNVVLRGDGVFHWGIYNYSDGLQLAYTMLWFDGTNSTGVEFNNDGGDSWNGIYNIQIQGGLNPLATMDTLYRTSFTNFGLIGLQIYNTNWTWAGVFEAKHVAVNGFRVGINNDAGQAQFSFCQYAMNGVGFAEVGNPGDYYYLTNTTYCTAHPDYGTLYTNYLSVIQPHGPYGFGFADDAQNINCGGGIRIDGAAYYLTSARARHIQSDTTYMAYRIAFLSDGYYSFDDCYWEEYGNYNPLTTNAVVLLGNPNVTIRNTEFVSPSVNDWGASNTNTCFVDMSQAGIATLTLDDCGNKAPQYLAKVNPLLQQPVNLKGSTAGLLWFQDNVTPARSHADLVTSESHYNGHFWQINDEEQYPPPSTTTNLSAYNYYEPYGRIIMQRSTPDYFSAVVRTNSIGTGVGSESTQLPYSAGSYYWIRFLQSDQSPPIQVANNIWEIPANYTVAQLTVKSNLFANLISGNGASVTNLANGVPAGVTTNILANIGASGATVAIPWSSLPGGGGGSIPNGLVTNSAPAALVVTGGGASVTVASNLLTVAGSGVSTTVSSNVVISGTVTATNFVGNGGNLTNLAAGLFYVMPTDFLVVSNFTGSAWTNSPMTLTVPAGSFHFECTAFEKGGPPDGCLMKISSAPNLGLVDVVVHFSAQSSAGSDQNWSDFYLSSSYLNNSGGFGGFVCTATGRWHWYGTITNASPVTLTASFSLYDGTTTNGFTVGHGATMAVWH